MKISTRTRYGVRTMIEVAKGTPEQGVFQKDIAASQSLSNKYLDHIIQALKTAHLIRNARGRKSGYILTRDPSAITIFDIHLAFEPWICLVDCISGDYRCELMDDCQAIGFWGTLNRLIIDYFKSVTLEDLINGKIRLDKDTMVKEP